MVTGIMRRKSKDIVVIFEIKDCREIFLIKSWNSTLIYKGIGYLMEWNRTFGGTSKDYGRGIALNSEDDIYITGYTESFYFSRNHLPHIFHDD